jgi:hypothetical protein
MSFSAATNPTYIDLLKLISPDGAVMPVAELLNETNDGLLDYISFMEGNLPTGHRYAQRTGLPAVSRGRINKGVVSSKGDTVQVTDNTGLLEAMSEVAARLVDMAPDPGAFRLTQDRPFLESMNQQFFRDLWRGDETVDPDSFTGLTPRYSDPTAANGDNIINAAGGTTAVTGNDIFSIWLICWSPTTVTGIIPKRTQANLKMEDRGMVTLDDDGSGTGARLDVYRTKFEWYTGLAVPDWRYAVRLCNVKLADVKDDASTGPNLPFLMKDMIERLPSVAGRCGFYMPRALVQKFRRQVPAALETSSLTQEMVGGMSPRLRPVFDGIPIFRTDSLVRRTADGNYTSAEVAIGAKTLSVATGEAPVAFS